MDEKSPDKLGFKDRMLIFTALEKTYGRECAFDIATKSDDHVLKLVAIAAADEQRPGPPARPRHPACQDGWHAAHDALAGSAASTAPSIAPLRSAEAGPHHEAAREGARLMRNR